VNPSRITVGQKISTQDSQHIVAVWFGLLHSSRLGRLCSLAEASFAISVGPQISASISFHVRICFFAMSTATHPAETNAAGVVTSWLPVTTAWPSQAGCEQAIYSQPGVGGKAIVFDPFFAEDISAGLTCLPPAATLWWHQSDTKTTYSLGPLACPEAYSTGGTGLVSAGSTMIVCCPT
jgi:hypothetical protein